MEDLIIKIFWWFGFANHPNGRNDKCKISLLLQFLLVTTFIDNTIMNLIIFIDPMFTWKLVVQYILFLSVSVIIVFVMTRKKQELTNLIKMLQMMCPEDLINKTNVAIYCIFVLPFVYAFSMLTAHEVLGQKYVYKYFSYGFESENKIMKYSVGFYKLFTFYLLHPTLANLITVVYSTSCCVCCRFLNILTSELEMISPDRFTLKVEMEILKKRHHIFDMLEMIETSLSTASFLTCTAHFLACLSNLSQLLMYLPGNKTLTILAVSFISGSAVVSTAFIFLNAGQIPIEMEKFSRLLRRRIEQRSFLGLDSLKVRSERSVTDEQVFVLSGCDLIYYRKSTLLSLLGTILTYGLLILSIEFQTDFSKRTVT
ncbi:hypothetical protein AVEN_111979-1 [Araneus ventricosus]|uniref:Gustatory receptor n=1 Tax=Araneus ventricosus TaxID=182803 RepID=A0A4Y2NHM6_ARAVE|nr:hypothetical protein AVEN_111979-1 [Araneus ventricosus]